MVVENAGKTLWFRITVKGTSEYDGTSQMISYDIPEWVGTTFTQQSKRTVPTSVAADGATPGSVSLSWEKPTTIINQYSVPANQITPADDAKNPIMGYQVRYREVGATDDDWSYYGIPGNGSIVKGTSCTISDLDPATKYEFQVRAINTFADTRAYARGFSDWTKSARADQVTDLAVSQLTSVASVDGKNFVATVTYTAPPSATTTLYWIDGSALETHYSGDYAAAADALESGTLTGWTVATLVDGKFTYPIPAEIMYEQFEHTWVHFVCKTVIDGSAVLSEKSDLRIAKVCNQTAHSDLSVVATTSYGNGTFTLDWRDTDHAKTFSSIMLVVPQYKGTDGEWHNCEVLDTTYNNGTVEPSPGHAARQNDTPIAVTVEAPIGTTEFRVYTFVVADFLWAKVKAGTPLNSDEFNTGVDWNVMSSLAVVSATLDKEPTIAHVVRDGTTHEITVAFDDDGAAAGPWYVWTKANSAATSWTKGSVVAGIEVGTKSASVTVAGLAEGSIVMVATGDTVPSNEFKGNELTIKAAFTLEGLTWVTMGTNNNNSNQNRVSVTLVWDPVEGMGAEILDVEGEHPLYSVEYCVADSEGQPGGSWTNLLWMNFTPTTVGDSGISNRTPTPGAEAGNGLGGFYDGSTNYSACVAGYNVIGLNAGKTLLFRITIKGTDEYDAASQVIAVDIPSWIATNVGQYSAWAITLPTGLTATKTGSTASLSWNASTPSKFTAGSENTKDNPIAGYQVRYREVGTTDDDWSYYGVPGNGTIIKETSCTLSGLNPAKEYEFQVRAISTYGETCDHARGFSGWAPVS